MIEKIRSLIYEHRALGLSGRSIQLSVSKEEMKQMEADTQKILNVSVITYQVSGTPNDMVVSKQQTYQYMGYTITLFEEQ